MTASRSPVDALIPARGDRGGMRNATIATSRTRATTDLIDYRPLPAAWGDVESLRAVRATKARAADRGLDPSTLEIAATDAASHRSRRPLGARRSPADRMSPLALFRREHGAPPRTGHTTGPLATA